MAQASSLRRLIGSDVGPLLDDMAAAVPGFVLALLDADGSVAHATGPWPPADGGAGRDALHAAHRLAIAPRGEVLGWLVAEGPETDGSGAAADGLVRGLHRSLTVLVRELLDKKDLARETLERYREINLLYRAGVTIGACLDAAEVPRLVLSESERVIPSTAGLVLAAGVTDADDWPGSAVRGAPDDVGALRRETAGLIRSVAGSGRADIATWPDGSGRFGSAMCAPVVAGASTLGMIVLGRSSAMPVFTAGDEKLLVGLATQAGVALERAWLHERETRRQRLDQELAVARRIQLTLLPASTPDIPGWSFAATYQAAREVGGDFYDFVRDPAEQRLGLVIADVTGKGVPAALMMAYSRAVLRAESMAGRTPVEVLQRTNRLIMQDRPGRLFVTAFYAELDVRSGSLAYGNAGHEAPLRLAATGDSHPLAGAGVLLGAFADIGVEGGESTLLPGESLVLFTDGVTEARSPDGELFGDARLAEAARAAARRHHDATAILEAITSEIAAFTAGADQADDLTMVVVRRDTEDDASA